MKYTEAKIGRAFVLRLEDGDILHEELEQFANILFAWYLSA